MRVRYRRVADGFDLEEYRVSGRVMGGIDGEAIIEEARELLRRGTLQENDLVDAGDGWTTFAECPHFRELCDFKAGRHGAALKRIELQVALAVVGSLAFIGGVYWLLRR